jgi:autoinducer 2 (AI-2) kinase
MPFPARVPVGGCVTRRFALGLDLGGGGARAALLDLDGHVVHIGVEPLAPEPDPGVLAGMRFAPEAVWRAVCTAAARARERAGAHPDQVVAVAASSVRHASVVLDAAGQVLLATPNRDARGFAAAAEWAAQHGEELQRRTGRWPHAIHPACRLAALARQAPDQFERAHTHLALSDWLAFVLCGERASDPTQAGETLVFELEQRRFADDLIGRLGLPRALFPAVAEAGTRLGRATSAAAQELGVADGAAVGVGAADTQSALLGAGALAPGAWCIVAGSTIPVLCVQGEPRAHPRLWTGHAPEPGRYVLESNAGGVGETLDSVAGALYAHGPHPMLQLLDDAARARPSAGGALVSGVGEVMDARALSLPLATLRWTPLAGSDGPGRRALFARALLEGAAFTLRANAEQLAGAADARPTSLHAVGGLAQSRFFTQLLADTLGVEIAVPTPHHATALGAALCAAVAAGVFPSLAAAASACVRVARRHAPDPAAHAQSSAGFEVWQALRATDASARGAATAHALRHIYEAPARSDAVAVSRPRVLVASDMDDESLAALRQHADVEYASFRQASRLLRGDALVTALEGVQVFVTEIDVVEASALVRCKDLRAIAVCRGDAVNVDVAACTALGIPVTHTPGRNADAVADLTLAFLLMLARKLPAATAFLREPGGKAGDLGRMGRAFVTFQGRELWRRRVGLIGLGAVGRKVLARLRGFEAHVLVHDPMLSDDQIRLAGAEPVALPELLARSELVSLHAAVTDATRGLIDAKALAAMPQGACLVNTARAALVDETALAEALRSGHLGGAALDVFAVEPPGSDHPLLALPQVIATPHMGGNTKDVAAHQGRIVASELSRLIAGQRPQHCLNPETLAGFSWSAPRPDPPADLLERLGSGPGPAVTDLQRDAAPRERKG